MLDKAFDLLEEGTGTDLDGDGVIGAAVKEALEIDVDDAPEAAPADVVEKPEVEDADEAPAVEDEPVEVEMEEDATE